VDFSDVIPDALGDDRPSALFITSNGAGMGHLTRLLAYARRLDDRVRSHFVSLSQAVGVVGTYGIPYEYLPSSGASGLMPREWNRLFAARVLETIQRVRPEVVIFDGTYPYGGIANVRKSAPEPKWVWSRRGMWKAEHGGERGRQQVGKAMWFDAVLEPGDLAESYDRGLTAGQPAHRVGPVTLLDVGELADRNTARSALGLPNEGRMALVSLGAGNINDTSGDLGAAVEALRKLDIDVCVTDTQIGGAGSIPDDVHTVQHFPLSEYLRAFDVAISAAGYNSFHELLRFGVPSLLVPNPETSLDDQVSRARFASDHGLAHSVDSLRVTQAVELLGDLLDNGPALTARVRAYDNGNGAAEASDFVTSLTSVGERGHDVGD
jgi:UDP:flavonoid glycosyltransferase YjiC (YdhE family)